MYLNTVPVQLQESKACQGRCTIKYICTEGRRGQKQAASRLRPPAPASQSKSQQLPPNNAGAAAASPGPQLQHACVLPSTAAGILVELEARRSAEFARVSARRGEMRGEPQERRDWPHCAAAGVLSPGISVRLCGTLCCVCYLRGRVSLNPPDLAISHQGP